MQRVPSCYHTAHTTATNVTITNEDHDHAICYRSNTVQSDDLPKTELPHSNGVPLRARWSDSHCRIAKMKERNRQTEWPPRMESEQKQGRLSITLTAIMLQDVICSYIFSKKQQTWIPKLKFYLCAS